MKPVVDLNTDQINVDMSLDGVIIRKNMDSYSATLDMTGFTEKTIQAGRVILKKADGTHLLQTLTTGAYVAPETGETYVGVSGSTILASKPFVAVVNRGTVNTAAMEVAPTAAAMVALPHILFTQDY